MSASVTADSLPKPVIHPPMTTGDKGVPTSSILKDAQRVFAFIEDERHLVAHELYTHVVARLEEWEQNGKKQGKKHFAALRSKVHNMAHHQQHKHAAAAAEEFEATKKLLQDNQHVLEKLANRCRIFRRAQKNLNTDEDWTFASLHFGITTYYRRETDGSLSIKLEGDISGVPLFEQIAVLRDVDNHHKWVPFCSSSMTVAALDKLDIVGWFMTGVPQLGLARDGCFRVIGCDNLSEDGSVLIAGQGVNDLKPGDPPPADTYLLEDPIIPKLNIPPVPTRRGLGRMTIRKFETIIHIKSPTSATTRIVANIDPNISFLSQGIIDFVLKHLAGVVLNKLQTAAKKVVKNPITNHHAQKMREESEFYQNWLMAKFKCLCDERGWDMPTVTAFALNEEQIMQSRYERKHPSPKERGETDVQSAKSTPTFPTVDHDDSLSEITTKSSLSLWHKNPVSNYIRQAELRAQQKKEAAVAEVRQRVADMMKPKQLAYERRERLEELKVVKQRRMYDNGTSGSSVGSGENREPVASRGRAFWSRQSHGKFGRTVVTCLLVAALFIVLHPTLLFPGVVESMKSSSKPWKAELLWDLVTFSYILLCSLCHFLLCDSALNYAFGALDLGSKAGNQVKSYYSRNVQLAVAAVSFGIMGISIMKALMQVGTRFFILYSVQLYHRAYELLQNPDAIFNLILSYPVLADLWDTVQPWAVSVSYVVRPIFKAVLNTLSIFLSVPTALLRRSSGFILGYIQVDERYTSWRHDAFATAESLLSYSAVFLLVSCFLFNISAQRPRPEDPRSPKKRILLDVPPDSASKSSSTTAGDVAEGKFSPSSHSNLSGARVQKYPSSPDLTSIQHSSSSGARRRGVLRLGRTRSSNVSDVSDSSAKMVTPQKMVRVAVS